MTTFVFPTLANALMVELELGLRSNTQVFTSDLSGQVQTIELPGTRWTLSFRYEAARRADGDASLLESFLAKLRGQANRARVPVFTRRTARGTWAGTPLVKGANQTGNTLLIDGLSVGATMKEGDYFNIGTNGELKILTADAVFAGPDIEITFEPPMRESPADNTALVVTDPVIPKMILTDTHPRWNPNAADLTSFAFDMLEVF